MNKILDGKYIMKNTKNVENLKVKLKKTFKGYSLFATKNIKKGNIISYYKIKVFKFTDKFKGINNNMYTFSIYTKNDVYNPRYIGDIYEDSIEEPRYNIPFWGYFANEPCKNQEVNSYIDTNLKENYKNRSKIKEGDVFIYRLVATKDIKAGDEVCWYYGEHYNRDYEIDI